jgi:hypothetical protein
MTDLQINIALAKAMGWLPYDKQYPINSYKYEDGYLYCWCNWYWREFSYCDPIIFVSICKHWDLNVQFGFQKVHSCYGVKKYEAETIEKAAALCVIEAAKRGVI